MGNINIKDLTPFVLKRVYHNVKDWKNWLFMIDIKLEFLYTYGDTFSIYCGEIYHVKTTIIKNKRRHIPGS